MMIRLLWSALIVVAALVALRRSADLVLDRFPASAVQRPAAAVDE